MRLQSHFSGSYNDKDHTWAAKISKQLSASCKTRKLTFLVEFENGSEGQETGVIAPAPVNKFEGRSRSRP
jgi:hypothetical protein